MSEDDNPLLHGFYYNHGHSLDVRVSGLRLSSTWHSDDPLSDPANQIKLGRQITGIATTGSDAIAVIGMDATKTQTLRFTLESFDSWESLSESTVKQYEFVGEHYGSPPETLPDEYQGDDANAVHIREMLAHSASRLLERTSTAQLGFTERDWELGGREGWYLSIDVPNLVFEALANDLVAHRCDCLRVLVELNPNLSTFFRLPRSQPVTFGVLRRSKFDDGTVDGWCEYLGWSLEAGKTPTFLAEEEIRENDERQAEHPITVEELAKSIATLTKTVRWGMVFILILLALIAVFR